jgi:hypothetical protein
MWDIILVEFFVPRVCDGSGVAVSPESHAQRHVSDIATQCVVVKVELRVVLSTYLRSRHGHARRVIPGSPFDVSWLAPNQSIVMFSRPTSSIYVLATTRDFDLSNHILPFQQLLRHGSGCAIRVLRPAAAKRASEWRSCIRPG